MSKELTFIIIFSLILLGGVVKIYLDYKNPYAEKVIERRVFHDSDGFFKKYIDTIERTYKNGKVKIITKHVRY